MSESTDFVMYWWDRAAELLTRKGTKLRRFGLVTTNSISQVFNRRTVERHMAGKAPISIVFTAPDHPWTKATKDSAAVRIAMTVGEAGERNGSLLEVVSESALETDEPALAFEERYGRVNADLSIGTDTTRARPLTGNRGISWNGMMLAARGFVLNRAQSARLRELDRAVSDQFIRPFTNGGDLVRKPQQRHVIDFFGLSASQARAQAPATYAHLLGTVKPDRDKARDQAFREKWWIFGRTRPDLRSALAGTARYIGTTETAKHRIFQFLDAATVPDHMVIAIAIEDAQRFAVLSSRIHVTWALATGGTLEDRPRYSKSRCFDPFPFPDPSDALRQTLQDAGEELDALRKRVLADHADLTLTGLYNVVEKLRAGTGLTDKDEDVKERGLVLILKELHETIDRLTAEAYGWPVDLSDEQILERLVALNAERAREEANGHVRWLRPDYQIPRFAKGAKTKTGELDLVENVVAIDAGKPLFPKDRYEQPLAVEAMLAASARPMDAENIARAFRGGGKRIEARVAQVLATLARYGRVSALPGGTFASRRAA